MLIEWLGKPCLVVNNATFRYVSHTPEGITTELELDGKIQFLMADSQLTAEQVRIIYNGRFMRRADNAGTNHKSLQLRGIAAISEF